jgi:hypothetical protein
MSEMTPDFSGYVFKAGKQAKGQVVSAEAFKAADGATVPVTWLGGYDADDMLGHAVLHHQLDGITGDIFFNDTEQGQNAKNLVAQDGEKRLSIYATHIEQNGDEIVNGVVRVLTISRF